MWKHYNLDFSAFKKTYCVYSTHRVSFLLDRHNTFTCNKFSLKSAASPSAAHHSAARLYNFAKIPQVLVNFMGVTVQGIGGGEGVCSSNGGDGWGGEAVRRFEEWIGVGGGGQRVNSMLTFFYAKHLCLTLSPNVCHSCRQHCPTTLLADLLVFSFAIHRTDSV